MMRIKISDPLPFSGRLLFASDNRSRNSFCGGSRPSWFIKIYDTCGVTQDLNRLDAGEIRKEPAATREHQQRASLHFQQIPNARLF